MARGWELHDELSRPCKPIYTSPRDDYDPEAGWDLKHAVVDEILNELIVLEETQKVVVH